MLQRPETMAGSAVSPVGTDFVSPGPAVAFDLVTELEELVHTLGPIAHRARLELICRLAPEVPARIVGDSVRLLGTLTLLVENAVRVADLGEVVVTVSVPHSGGTPSPFAEDWQSEGPTQSPVAGGGTSLLFEVSGTCRESARHDRARQDEGTAGLVESLGVLLTVRREPGRGRVWSFRLDLGPADAAGEPVQQVPPGIGGSSILLADDNATARSVLAGLLSGWGARVGVAECGHTALSAIRQAADGGRPFDALLLDARMPRLSGFAVAEHLVKNPGLCGPPLLLLPAPFRKGDDAYCRRLGVAARVAKPVRRAELLQALGQVLAARGALPPSSLLTGRAREA
jgi:CheY-like chemotaxis protein